jgi:FkbM family methyltransferase
MYRLKNILFKIQLRFYKNTSWKYYYILQKLHNKDAISKSKNRLYFKKLDIVFDKNKFLFLLIGYEYALQLKEIGANFIIQNNSLIIELEELVLEVQTTEELFILKEIYVEGVYNFKLFKDSQNYLLIDIGMNVAYASCYFSKIKKIPHIISFEPFTPTYNQAKINISKNNLEESIDARNYGLGDCDKDISVQYTPEFKGQVGMQGIDTIRSDISVITTEIISIKKAFEPLDKIEKEYPNKRFILKIDCEGAEYDLIDVIPKALLQRCDLIMMEWHEKGPKKIEEWLVENGFIQMSFYPNSKRVGMIYAIKNI